MRIIFCILILAIIPMVAFAAHPDDIYWSDGFGPPSGVWGDLSEGMWVISATTYDTKLVLGGRFHVAGSDTAGNIATWDSGKVHAFKPLARATINKLIVYKDHLYAFGENFNAVLAGNTWQEISTLHGTATEAIIYNDKLVIVGAIDSVNGQPAGGLAIYDGIGWSPVANAPSGNFGWAAVDTCWGKLVMTGRNAMNFGSDFVLHFWDGLSWETLSLTGTGSIRDIANFRGKLIVAGRFDSLQGEPVKNLAEFDGTAWSEFGGGAGDIYSLLAIDSELVVLGAFDSIGGVGAQGAAYWANDDWHTMGSGLNPVANRKTSMARFGNYVVAMGEFYTKSGETGNYYAEIWDGTAWLPVSSNGISGTTHRLTEYHGELIAGGDFGVAGNVASPVIAAWNGAVWHGLGTAVRSNRNYGITALKVYDDKLFAGGYFDSIAGIRASSAAYWDGEAWHTAGDGIIGQPVEFYVYNNALLAGGYIRQTSLNDHTNNVVAWDGNRWSFVGSSFISDSGTAVSTVIQAFCEYNGRLIIAGHFDSCGTAKMTNIAAWNGTDWEAITTANSHESWAEITDLLVYDNKVIACGHFTAIDDVPANHIAQWDGHVWSALGSGISDAYSGAIAMVEYDGQVIVAGMFDSAGGLLVNHIAAWDGENWSSLGSGLTKSVYSWQDPFAANLLAFDHALYVVGNFLQAGDKGSFNIARWTKHTPTDVNHPTDSPLPHSLLLQQNYPNPFNPNTRIEYSLSRREHVTVTILNSLGQTIRTLVDLDQPAGDYLVDWDGRSDSGTHMATGVYLYQIHAGDKIETKKMLLMK